MSTSYALRAERNSFPPGERIRWNFEVVGPNGRPSTYRMQHERELHLIVVRDDLSTFAHLHPERDDQGEWTVDLSLPKPGSYAAFADVAPDNEEATTLRLGLTAEGGQGDENHFSPSTVTAVDDYRVELFGDVEAGAGSDIEFHVTRNEEAIEPDPYLGAAGHLVAIKTGDLDYLHVHPMDSQKMGVIPFMMHAATPGLYRLFLQFLHDGKVRTADFTINV